MSSIISCSDPNEFPHLKRGAWQIESTLSADLKSAPSEIRDSMRAAHPEWGVPRTSRLCITGDVDETKLLTTIPAVSSCNIHVTRRTKSERFLKQECELMDGRKRRSTHEFRFQNDEFYTELSFVALEPPTSSSNFPISITIKNLGKYLGPNCSDYDAKTIWERGKNAPGR